MTGENTIESNYTKERFAFLRRRFRFVYCPASVLLGCACMECPLKEKCVKCNPGNLLGIDHQASAKQADCPAFYDMHIIEHYGSGMRRMKKDCDENGSPYPAMKSGNGEFRIKFSARTKESVAKLGIPPEKFGIKQTKEVAENVGATESAQTKPESAKAGAESAQTGAENAKTRAGIEALLDSYITDTIRSDARRNMIAILDCLSKHSEKSAAWIAKELGLSQSATQKIMGTLQKAGLLRREGPDFGGHWKIAQTKP